MTPIWNTVLMIFAFSTICACVSMTWNYFLKEGFIFHPIGKFLDTLPNRVKDENNKAILRFIRKPLGLCVFCNNVWVNIFCVCGLSYFGVLDIGLFLTIFYMIAQASVSTAILYHLYY